MVIKDFFVVLLSCISEFFIFFGQETTETVTFRMLDKVVAIEMINQTLERQIRPYMREYNLREDIIFSKYIKVLHCVTGTNENRFRKKVFVYKS